jgi:hypothetical protein
MNRTKILIIAAVVDVIMYGIAIYTIVTWIF